MGQFIQSSIGNVADPLIEGLKQRERGDVLSKLPRSKDGKFDYDASIDYLLRSNQPDIAVKLAQHGAGSHKVYGNVLYGYGPDGQLVIGSHDARGQFVPIPTPGFTPTMPVGWRDTGTGFQASPNRMPMVNGQPGPPPQGRPPVASGQPPQPQLDINSEGIPPSQAARVNAPQPGSSAPIQPTPVQSVPVRPPQGTPGFIPKDVQGREAAEAQGQAQGRAVANYPQIVAATGTSLRLIDEAIKHPGRETATGLSGTFDPRNYISGTNAKDFQIRSRQLEGRVFLDAFDQLRGGGAITEAEGNKATAAHARLDRAQSDGEYLAALKELRGILMKGLKVARLRAQGRWADADRELGAEIPDVTVEAPGSGSDIDNLVKKYLKK